MPSRLLTIIAPKWTWCWRQFPKESKKQGIARVQKHLQRCRRKHTKTTCFRQDESGQRAKTLKWKACTNVDHATQSKEPRHNLKQPYTTKLTLRKELEASCLPEKGRRTTKKTIMLTIKRILVTCGVVWERFSSRSGIKDTPTSRFLTLNKSPIFYY